MGSFGATEGRDAADGENLNSFLQATRAIARPNGEDPCVRAKTSSLLYRYDMPFDVLE